jgi:transposase
MFRVLKKLRTDVETKSKPIVILMDNASIHKHESVYATVRKFKANILLNA